MIQSTADAYHQKLLSGTESKFVSVLMQLVCWGQVQWSVAQRLVAAQCEDNDAAGVRSHPDLQKLAGIGKSGAYSGNVRRDGLTQYKPSSWIQQILQFISVPVMKTKSLDRMEADWIWLPIILPNLLFEALYKGYPQKFASFLGEGLEAFWAQVHV